jgi:hypothetical protein
VLSGVRPDLEERGDQPLRITKLTQAATMCGSWQLGRHVYGCYGSSWTLGSRFEIRGCNYRVFLRLRPHLFAMAKPIAVLGAWLCLDVR